MYELGYIYDLIYKDIVTPYNLLENAKLDNYEYVKYYMKDNALIAEMKCNIARNDSRIFFYCFDSNNKLQKIFQTMNDSKSELLFDRKKELKNIENKLYKVDSSNKIAN